MSSETASVLFGVVITMNSKGGRLGGTGVSRLGRAPILAVASQAIGACQLLVLILVVEPGKTTDAYLYLWGIGLLPVSALLVSVLSPMLLNDLRLPRRVAARTRIVVPALSFLSTICGFMWLAYNDRSSSTIMVLAVLLAANAAVQSELWFRAVAVDSAGNASWQAGIAIIPNTLALVALLTPVWSDSGRVVAMAGGLLLGNTVMSVLMIRMSIGSSVVKGLPLDAPGWRSGACWFLFRSVSAQGALTVVQSCAVLLPPSQLTILTFIVKLVSAFTGSIVGALLPHFLHSSRRSIGRSRSFLWGIWSFLAILSAGAILLVASIRSEVTWYSALVAIWLFVSSGAAVARRQAFVSLSPSASKVTIYAVVAIAVAVLVISGTGMLSLIALICCYALIDGLSGLFLFVLIRDRLSVIVMAACCIALTGIGIWLR